MIQQRFNHWLPKLLKVQAMVLYPYMLFADVKENVPDWMFRHEFKHVEQVNKVGWVRYYVSYLLFYFAYRVAGLEAFEAYLSIPYEIEARAAEKIIETGYLPSEKPVTKPMNEHEEAHARSFSMVKLSEIADRLLSPRERFRKGDMITCDQCGNLQLTVKIPFNDTKKIDADKFAPVIQLRKVFRNGWLMKSYCCQTDLTRMTDGRQELHTSDGWR